MLTAVRGMKKFHIMSISIFSWGIPPYTIYFSICMKNYELGSIFGTDLTNETVTVWKLTCVAPCSSLQLKTKAAIFFNSMAPLSFKTKWVEKLCRGENLKQNILDLDYKYTFHIHVDLMNGFFSEFFLLYAPLPSKNMSSCVCKKINLMLSWCSTVKTHKS